MKHLTSWVLTGFLIFTSTPNIAAETDTTYPEAYAGLNKSAYHPITFKQNKSDGFSFKLEDKQISIDLNGAKSAGTSPANISFTQSIPNGSISATKGNNSLFGKLALTVELNLSTGYKPAVNLKLWIIPACGVVQTHQAGV